MKIAIDAGHSLNTTGKRVLKSLDPNETKEWVLNNRIANYVEDMLQNYSGYKLLRLDDRTGKKNVSLAERTKSVNSWGADILISIHHNAGINGGSGGGIVVYRQVNSLEKTKIYQKKIYDKLIKYTGLKGNRSTPLAVGNFHITRESKMPAVLIENGFMDSKTDVPIILSDKHAINTALAITEFLVEEFNLEKIEKITMYRLGDKGNGVKKLQEDLIKLGYSLEPYGADGVFGNITREAVNTFQSTYKLKIDGIAGPETLDKISELLSSQPSKIRYRVQVGYFSVKSNAEKLANELKSRGYEVYIIEERV